MDTTLSDFWKLISNRGCGVVVMLSELEEEGKEVCVQYWPTEGDSTEYGQYLVTTVKVHKNEGYIQRVLNVSNPKVPPPPPSPPPPDYAAGIICYSLANFGKWFSFS